MLFLPGVRRKRGGKLSYSDWLAGRSVDPRHFFSPAKILRRGKKVFSFLSEDRGRKTWRWSLSPSSSSSPEMTVVTPESPPPAREKREKGRRG